MSVADRHSFQVQHAEPGSTKPIHPVADTLSVVDDKQNRPRAFGCRDFLETVIKPLLLSDIASLPSAIEDFVHFGIAVAPVVAVPRAGAVVPLVAVSGVVRAKKLLIISGRCAAL